MVKTNIKEKDWLKNVQLILVYSIASIVVVFPIADKGHFAIGTMCTLILGVYLLYILINYLVKEPKVRYAIVTFFKAISMPFLVIYIVYSISLFFVNIDKEEIANGNDLEHFAFIPIDKGIYDSIKNTDEFLLSKMEENEKVYILNTTAAIFNIPINIYNKDYDMFNIGNFGKKGEKRIN